MCVHVCVFFQHSSTVRAMWQVHHAIGYVPEGICKWLLAPPLPMCGSTQRGSYCDPSSACCWNVSTKIRFHLHSLLFIDGHTVLKPRIEVTHRVRQPDTIEIVEKWVYLFSGIVWVQSPRVPQLQPSLLGSDIRPDARILAVWPIKLQNITEVSGRSAVVPGARYFYLFTGRENP